MRLVMTTTAGQMVTINTGEVHSAELVHQAECMLSAQPAQTDRQTDRRTDGWTDRHVYGMYGTDAANNLKQSSRAKLYSTG